MNSTPASVRTFPPEASEGWTISFIERKSRYWLEASAGLKQAELFEQGVQRAWQWAEPSTWIRWFTDGERRYGKALWKLASVYLPSSFTCDAYPYRKVWREGLEVAIKIKGSQGEPRIEWLKVEHPWTAQCLPLICLLLWIFSDHGLCNLGHSPWLGRFSALVAQ
jgi:hypothetical protein